MSLKRLQKELKKLTKEPVMNCSAGPINDDLIYYIRSRGLTKLEATKILIQSFVQDDILAIKDEDIKSQVLSHLDNYLNRIN